MTNEQRRTLDAVKRLTVRGVTPTYEQLAQDLGLSGKSAVWRQVQELAQAGYLEVSRGRTGIRLAGPPAHIVAAIAEACSTASANAVGKALPGPALEETVRKAWLEAL